MPFLRALVTGAGFLGSHVCERCSTPAPRWSASTTSPPAAQRTSSTSRITTLFDVDVTESLPLLPRFDLVCHLASPASPVHYQRLGVATLRAGADGTARALQVAAGDGARFLLASTSEVYGDPAVHPQTESYWGKANPVGPRSVYDEAKRDAEALTAAYHRDHGTDVCIARIFNTYGPRMRYDDGRMIPTFVQQALAGRDGHRIGAPDPLDLRRRHSARADPPRRGAATTLPGHHACSSCPRLEPAHRRARGVATHRRLVPQRFRR